MKRQIKFRGKTEAGEWVYGDLVHTCCGDVVIQSVGGHGPCNEDPCGGFHYVSDKVIPSSVGQFTGIKDKNGTDIYEGDMLKGMLGHIHIISTVMWINGVWVIKDEYKGIDQYLSLWASDLIIIGETGTSELLS